MGRPKKPRAAALLKSARNFAELQEYEMALYLCELAAAEDLNNALPYFVGGRCLDALGRFEEAVAQLENAAALEPKDAYIQAAYGEALQHSGRLERARDCYGLALKLDPNLIGPLLARAVVSQRLADFESALVDLNAYLDHRPDSADALVHRGCCHLAAGQREDADRDFDRAIMLDPSECERIKRLTTGL